MQGRIIHHISKTKLKLNSFITILHWFISEIFTFYFLSKNVGHQAFSYEIITSYVTFHCLMLNVNPLIMKTNVMNVSVLSRGCSLLGYNH